MDNLITITIPKFAREIKVTNARRAKYYKSGEDIPKKYQTPDYNWLLYKGKLVWCNLITKEPVIKNPNAAGTPKFETINGNDLWSGAKRDDYKDIFKASIQVWFWECIKLLNLEKTNIDESLYPLQIVLNFHTYKENQDLDNLDTWFRKCFLDAIQDVYTFKETPKKLIETRFIRNDNTKIIKSIHSEHHDCRFGEDALIIEINRCYNKVIDYNKEDFIKL